MPKTDKQLTVVSGLFKIKPPDSLHNSCRAVWVCKRCGNCALHCKHDDLANFHEDLDLPCSGPCQCIDCVPCAAGTEVFRIKPLGWEWAETPIRRGFVSQRKGFSFYAFVFQSGRDGEWGERWCLDVFTDGELELDARLCASPEEGKQLAEAHWQNYIQQALVLGETNE